MTNRRYVRRGAARARSMAAPAVLLTLLAAAGCGRPPGRPAVAGLGVLASRSAPSGPATGTAPASGATGSGPGHAGTADPARTGVAGVPARGPGAGGTGRLGGDGVPTRGDGTFAVAPGAGARLGTGATLVMYRVEVERGIDWGGNEVWTPESFAAVVDGVLGDARGWTASARSPVTDGGQGLTRASWSFQRVGAGAAYRVRVLLATPDTTTRMCASAGMDIEGVYSCRYGDIEVINLRRWLRGVPGFPIDIGGYHVMVINHEMGHFLGFAHMACPGAGRPAPVMQTQTIGLGGCQVNPYPFAADGSFIGGPWSAS